jgi:hypothetical protein
VKKKPDVTGRGFRTLLGAALCACLSACGGGAGDASSDGTNSLREKPQQLQASPVAPPSTRLPPPADVNTNPDWVHVPSMLVHRSCVRQVPEGAIVDGNHDVVKDGKVLRHDEPCNYQSVPARRNAARADTSPPNVDGWEAWIKAPAINSYGMTYFNAILGTWTVPPYPTNASNALIYWFNGFQDQDLPNTTAIIQAVLQYGDNGYFGSNGNYYIAGWNIFDNGAYVYYGSVFAVYPGNVLSADVQENPASNCPGGSHCWWKVTITNSGGANAYLDAYTWNTMTMAYKGVMEVYNLGYCDEYPTPAHTSMLFYNTYVYEPGPTYSNYRFLNDGSLTWSMGVAGFVPSCNVGGVANFLNNVQKGLITWWSSP